MSTEDVINEAARPTEAELLQARAAMTATLEAGVVVSAHRLVSLLADTDLGEDSDRTRDVELSSQHPSLEDVRDAPAVRWSRLYIAGMWALAELVARGAVIPCVTPSGESVPNLASALSVSWASGGHRQGVQITLPIPRLEASHYRRAVTAGSAWFSASEPFLTDLHELDLEPRTQRCIREAIEAWRRGLWLATANMLGAAFEGAWMAAATELRGLDEQVARALDDDPPSIAKVQQRLATFMSSHRKLRRTADELTSHASLLRELRNYGVHPKPETDDRLERYLDEPTMGLLVLTTHHHLSALAEAVETLRGAADGQAPE